MHVVTECLLLRTWEVGHWVALWVSGDKYTKGEDKGLRSQSSLLAMLDSRSLDP